MFYLRSSLWSSDLSLFYFHGFFPSLSFSHHHFGLLFPILTHPHSPLKVQEAQVFGNGMLRSSWLLPDELGGRGALGPPPLASIKPQSPYTCVHLRISDGFRGQVVLYILVELSLHIVAY